MPLSTLVFINPDENNGFQQESLVDCNSSCFKENESFLRKINSESGIKVRGFVKQSVIEQLRRGIKNSPMVTGEMKKLLDS